MDIQIYEDAANREQWLEQLKNCDWKAGAFLYSLLKEYRFQERYGKKAKVLLLADGTKLASFCTYAEKDEIPDTERKPWIGFVYTYPEYRGRRLMGKLIARVKELAREDGYDTVYVSTREQGLYEKYGAEFVAEMKDTWGEDSQVFRMNTYGFYGWETALVPAKTTDYPGICTPRDLYNTLWHVWKKETCAPRMQQDWSEENRTLGQCSITAFLAQDIFGGKVWGVPLEDGNYHCFNAVGDCVFDLTSEQFGDEKLDYSLLYEQTREEHFRKHEKYERYEALKAGLSEQCRIKNAELRIHCDRCNQSSIH